MVMVESVDGDGRVLVETTEMSMLIAAKVEESWWDP
jgi:hypothetical protein